MMVTRLIVLLILSLNHHDEKNQLLLILLAELIDKESFTVENLKSLAKKYKAEVKDVDLLLDFCLKEKIMLMDP